MFLFFFDKTIAGFLFGLISGVYGTVAKVYDILLDLISASNEKFIFDIPNIVDSVYVAAGIFMLFRVIISMIQMFLNPDLVTDNQVGAGKLISRIITSVALLMLLQPSSIILGENGIFARIEKALLDSEDGFITNIMNTDPPEPEQTLSSTSNTKNEKKINLFYDDVYAAPNPNLTCYYYRIEDYAKKEHTVTVNKVYKISFYFNVDNTNGLTAVENSKKGGDSVYYKVHDQRIGGVNGAKDKDGNNIKYNTLGYPLSGTYLNTNDECPPKIRWSSGKWVISDTQRGDSNVNGLSLGGTSLSQLKSNLYNFSKSYGVESSNQFVLNNITVPTERGVLEYDSAAIAFARTIAGTFMDCIGDEKCEQNKDEMFVEADANENIIDDIADDNMRLDWFTGLLIGLGVIVYLVILCIDVIVRRLKLLLLEMISPIPIISYIDPKDKMLASWFKMYMSTYADLFIKLIGLAMMVSLLSSDFLSNLWGEGTSLFVKLLYIIAILVFAKVVPSMISKIFGLENMSGSFKDILGMGKTAAGFGAGAVLGAGAGALAMGAGIMSGKGWKQKLGAGVSGLGGVASGALRGAGSGAKGNITGGASNVLSAAKQQRDARASGATYLGTKKAAMLNRLGFDNPYQKAEREYNASDNFLKNVDASNAEALKAAKKAAGNGSNVPEMAELRTAQDAVAAYKAGGQTWADFTASHKGYSKKSSSELESDLIGAEKAATAKVQADALYARSTGKSLKDLGYNEVGNDDTEKIAKQVENLRDEAVLLGQERISIEVGKDGHASFAKGKELKTVKTKVEDMKTTAQGQMTMHKADHDAAQRNNK